MGNATCLVALGNNNNVLCEVVLMVVIASSVVSDCNRLKDVSVELQNSGWSSDFPGVSKHVVSLEAVSHVPSYDSDLWCDSSAVIGREGLDLVKPPSYGGGAPANEHEVAQQNTLRTVQLLASAPSVRALLCKYTQRNLFFVLILMCTIKHSLLRQ